MDKPVKANIGILLAFLTTGERDYDEQTFFDKIYQLPGGFNLTYELASNQYKVEKWYNLKDEKKQYSYGEAKEIFEEDFRNAVKLRLRSDVPVGYTLSGGLDSSAVICVATELNHNKNATTFSSCFEDKRFDEQEYIDAVVDHTQVKNIKVWPDIKLNLKYYEKLIWHQDEPGVGSAAYDVYKAARENEIPVILVGEGADEQLAGYMDFFEALFRDLFQQRRIKTLTEQMNQYKKVCEPHNRVSLKHILSVSAADAILPVRLRDFIRINRSGYSASHFFPKKTLNRKEVYKARNLYSKVGSRQMISQYLFCEMPRILHDLDRSSMAHSIETRAPFLDDKLVQDLYNMPIDYKLWNGVTKRVMRDGIGHYMPDIVANRYGKMGFMSPEFQFYYQSPDEVTEILMYACEQLGSYVNKDAVKTWCQKQGGSVATFSIEEDLISRLFQVGQWMKVFHVQAIE